MLIFALPFLFLFRLTLGISANNEVHMSPHYPDVERRVTNSSSSSSPPLNSTQLNLDRAREVVNKAKTEWSAYKRERFANPHHNKYTLQPGPGNKPGARGIDNSTSGLVAPNLTDEILKAAALLAEANVANSPQNVTHQSLKKRAGKFWMETVDHIGTQPYGGNSSYKVFRNVVTDYGADPTGKQVEPKTIDFVPC
jgi:hypothetical protein